VAEVEAEAEAEALGFLRCQVLPSCSRRLHPSPFPIARITPVGLGGVFRHLEWVAVVLGPVSFRFLPLWLRVLPAILLLISPC